jgi:accessory gene regulator B
MLKKLVNRIAFLLEHNQIIEENDIEICSYGLELMLNNIITIFLLLLAGTLLKTIEFTIIFTVIFISVKRYTGGFHCKTYGKCLMVTMLVYILVMVPALILSKEIQLIIGIIFLTYSVIKIYITDPIVSINRPKTEDEIERCRRNKDKIITLILFIELILLIVGRMTSVFFVIAVSLMAIAINMVLSKKMEDEIA